MSVLQCPQCSATVEADDTTLATQCAFCDSPLLQSDEEAEPVDRVVPFGLTRERAGRALSGFLQGQWLAPNRLRTAARPEALDGVLVPFYAYEALAQTKFSCSVGIYWYRTVRYTTWENGKRVTKTKQKRETEWFPFEGTHAKVWHDHLVSASRGLTEAESNALEPFDLGKAQPFAPALTAGWLAEHPTIPHDEARTTARAELERREANHIATSFLPGNTHRSLNAQSSCDVKRVHLVLLPVWIAVYPGPKGPVRLLVNGQTGEVVGTVPRQTWKVVLAVLLALILGLGLLGGILILTALASVVQT